MEDSVLGSALKCLLNEMGCMVTEHDNIANITYRSRRIFGSIHEHRSLTTW